MRLLGSFACFRSRFHSGQQFSLSATFPKRVFAAAFGVMFTVTWGIATLFNAACVFVVHNLSFTAANSLVGADALFPSIEQDGSA